MSKTDKEFFEACYPKVSASNEIWKVLDEEFDIHFIAYQTFDLQFEYNPDAEHGLSVAIKNIVLRLK